MNRLIRNTVFTLLTVAVASFAQIPAGSGNGPTTATAQTDPAQGVIWDLTLIFPDEAALQRERLAILAELPSLADYEGHLGDSAATLCAALDRRTALQRRTRRVRQYAVLKNAEDARVEASQALLASADDLVEKFGAATAFYDPEIIALGHAKIAVFEAAEPKLIPHRRSLDLLERRAPHVLSPEVEAAIAASSALRQSPSNTHEVLTNAEMPWPSVMVHGKQTQLTRSLARRLMLDPDRDTRRAVFEASAAALAQFKSTQAALLQAHVGAAAYEAKLRHYPSSASFLLAAEAMPDGAFEALSKAADGEQAVINRYLRLRQQALGINDTHSYDLDVPLSRSSKRYSLDEAETIILRALAPLGQQYVSQLAAGFTEKRMHAIASPWKAPGARTILVDNDLPPFVLVSYTGSAESISIVAHEWGHAMHMDRSRAVQPAETAGISPFLGDAPSVVNELLVDDYMMKHASDREERIAALEEAIELLRGTYYRVLPLMRLEMAERAAADRGEPLTAEKLSGLNCDQLRAFNGADSAVTTVDPGACLSWVTSQEPYDNLYFFKYLTAVSAAAYFADGLEKDDAGLRDRFFGLLKAGSSDDPCVLLKRAGFDAREPAAYAAIGQRFEHYVDALEVELHAAGRVSK